MEKRKIRWGILGSGAIARQFAAGLRILPDAELAAVGSRARATAEAFGEAFRVPRRHASYAALAADPEVDVVYIATPHSLHRECTLLCLSEGKAVLCEKPFAINAAEAEEMIALARQKGLFLMEAMWTRFLPAIARVRELLAAGAIGELRMIEASFGFRASFDPQGRLFNPHLGGGALLDVGIYPLSLASMFLGAPTRIAGLAHLGESGVDEQSAFILGYADGQLAILSAAVRTETAQEAVLMGTAGRIHIHSPWWRAKALTLIVDGKKTTMRRPYKGNGYCHEALEVMDCLRAGRRESDGMPLDETLAIMRTMDAVRAQWGLRYPMEG